MLEVAAKSGASMANPPSENASDGKPKNSEGPHWIAVAAFVVGVFSFLYTAYENSTIGEVTPLELSGYAIVRGVDPSFKGEPKPGEGVGVGPWPSDHVVVPMEWRNSSGSSELVTDPELVFSELGRDDEPTGDKIKFFLVGELPEISPTVLNNINAKPYSFTNTLTIDPHSVLQSFLVFRVEGWDDKNRCFRFHQGQKYQVSIEYRRVPENTLLSIIYGVLGRSGVRSEDLVEKLMVLDTANWMSPYGRGKSIGWDFYSLLPGARATSDQRVPEDTKKHYAEPPECS